MLVMIEYTFTFKMVNKTKSLCTEREAGLTPQINLKNDSLTLSVSMKVTILSKMCKAKQKKKCIDIGI